MTVKTKILLPLSLLIATTFVILGYQMLSNNYNLHFENLKTKEHLIANDGAKYVDNYLQSKIDIINSLSTKALHFDRDTHLEDLRQILNLSKDAGGFGSVYIGFEDDGFMTRWSGRDTTPQKDNYDPRSRPWYKSALNSQKAGVTKPYIDSATKKLTISIYAPIMQNNKVMGVVGSDIFLDAIVSTVLDINIDDYGFGYLVDENGKILIHKDTQMIHKLNESFQEVINISDKFAQVEKEEKQKLLAIAQIDSTKWYLTVEIDKEKAFAPIYDGLTFIALFALFFLLFTIVSLYLFLNKVLSPLNDFQSGLLSFFAYLNRETSQVNTLNTSTNDEFGDMAKTVNENIQKTKSLLDQDQNLMEEAKIVINKVKRGWYSQHIESNTNNASLNAFKNDVNNMIKTTKKHFSTINETLNQYTHYDYTQKLVLEDIEKDGILEALTIDINKLRNSINEMLTDNKYNGLTLQTSAHSLMDNIDVLSTASNSTAASLEETSASLEEITETINNNTSNVVSMSRYANELITSANEGEELATQTTLSMDDINTHIYEINEAISVIDQIAFQTNILSLNAAVEAATAGESGKGFAVVAQEVRNLASRSSEAANEIKKLVENATNKANNGKDIADKMIAGYHNLNQNISKTLTLIKDIEASSKEQQSGIEQINHAVTTLDTQTQKNANVSLKTKEIANNTLHLATTVVEDTKKKRFKETKSHS